jgi:TIR domain-containing protein
MEKIFLNFRTGDQDIAAPFLYRCLSHWFGTGAVFFSSHSIPAGARFPDELERHAGTCQVLLALIGPRWLTMTGPDGRPLLANPDDWVRREIATALAAGRRVVPVLVGNAPRISPGGLPADLAPLAQVEYRYLRRRDLATDLQTLQDDLMKLIPGLCLRPEASAAVHAQVQVNQNEGYVAGVRVGELRSRGGSLPGITGSPSVQVDKNLREVVGVDIGKWDRCEEWGNAGEDPPPWPEMPA